MSSAKIASNSNPSKKEIPAFMEAISTRIFIECNLATEKPTDACRLAAFLNFWIPARCSRLKLIPSTSKEEGLQEPREHKQQLIHLQSQLQLYKPRFNL